MTHQSANKRALPVSDGDRFVIDYASVAVDAHQHPNESHMHAMRNKNEPDAAARVKANTYVRDNLDNAERLLCNCADAVSYLHALEFFGYALHTVQDSTSPAHNRWNAKNGRYEFRRWYGVADIPNVTIHVLRENFDPGYGSALYHATEDMWSYFKCKRNAPAFPTDFFTYGIDTSTGGSDD